VLEAKLAEGHEATLTESHELKELIQREFLRLFNRDQRLEESHCPSVFVVLPKDNKTWFKNVFGQKMELQLYCEAPGHWHPTYEGGRYEIKKQALWLNTMTPYITKLAKVIKLAVPLAGPFVGVVSAAFGEEFKHQLKLMEELARILAKDKDLREAAFAEEIDRVGRAEHAGGVALRTLRKLLDEVDPQQHWGGLKKVLTPEGHYLWLCEDHAEEYTS
jgi:hypothetical protein